MCAIIPLADRLFLVELIVSSFGSAKRRYSVPCWSLRSRSFVQGGRDQCCKRRQNFVIGQGVLVDFDILANSRIRSLKLRIIFLCYGPRPVKTARSFGPSPHPAWGPQAAASRKNRSSRILVGEWGYWSAIDSTYQAGSSLTVAIDLGAAILD